MTRFLKKQSRDEQIENTLVAIDMVASLPARAFVPGLNDWTNRCGSAACLGGWVAVHPFFRKKGVVTEGEMYPSEDISSRAAPFSLERGIYGSVWPSEIARRLFGNEELFDSRHYESGNHEPAGGKAIALARLAKTLDELLEDQFTIEELYEQAAAELDDPGIGCLIGACSALTRAKDTLAEEGYLPADQSHAAGPTLKKMMRPLTDQPYWLGDLNEKNKIRRVYCLLLAAQAWRDFAS